MELPRAADVVIVGGGVIGASVAYHLARAGRRDVVVLDRADAPGQGSTGKATGGFRAQFATEVNVRLSLRARERLLAFRDELGVDPGYEPVGYLWLARTRETLETLRGARQVQHACGLREATELAPDEVRRAHPHLVTDDLVGAAWCPTDGYINPLQVLRGFTEGAKRLGVRFVYGVEQCGFRTDGQVVSGQVVGGQRDERRIAAVRTSRGEIECDVVVNAAGAWAARVAVEAGVVVPVVPVRRQVAMTVPTDVLPASVPMTIVADDGFHFRWREDRVLFAWPTPGNPADPWDTDVEPAWVEEVTRRAHERVPALRGVAVDPARCWAGLYECSPDKLAIVGWAPGCANLMLANGCSGHGVMHSPAIGEAVAALICGEDAPLVSALSPHRFADPNAGRAAELL